MSGPTPITASHKLTFKYTCSLLQHRQQNFCEAVLSGDSTGFSIVNRLSVIPTPLSTIPDYFFTEIKPFYDLANATFDGWLLEELVGTVYEYRASGSTSIVPTTGGTSQIGMGWDLPGKDANNRNIHAYLYEGQFRFPTKINSYSSLNTAEKELVDYFFAVGRAAVDTDAYAWSLGRGNIYRKRWLSAVWDTNQKLRRVRRIS